MCEAICAQYYVKLVVFFFQQKISQLLIWVKYYIIQ